MQAGIARTGRTILALFVAAAMVLSVMFLLADPAEADHVDSWPSTAEANHSDFWEAWGAIHEGEDDWTCDKDETGSNDPYVLGDPPTGEVWRLIVVKAGNDINDLHWNPSSGDEFEHSVQNGWSHVIYCSRPEPEEEETTTTEAEETTTTEAEETTTTVEILDSTVTTEDTTTTTVEILDSTITTEASTTSSIEDEVLGTEVLPFTGVDNDLLALLAGSLAMLGSLVLIASRRVED